MSQTRPLNTVKNTESRKVDRLCPSALDTIVTLMYPALASFHIKLFETSNCNDGNTESTLLHQKFAQVV